MIKAPDLEGKPAELAAKPAKRGRPVKAAPKEPDDRPSLDLDEGIELDRGLLHAAKSIAMIGDPLIARLAELIDEFAAHRIELRALRQAIEKMPAGAAPSSRPQAPVPSGVK